MIAAVIRASLRNRLLVILAALMIAGWGGWAVQRPLPPTRTKERNHD